MAEPPGGYENLQEAVEAFLRSPLPRSPTSADAAEPWVPQITDVEEPTVLDGVVEHEPELDFVGPEDGRWAIAAVPLADGTYAAAAAPHDVTHPPGDEALPVVIAEEFAPGCRVRLFGRWANVHLVPTDDPWWPNGRMFVVERYELRA
jgi:hypothetical protein